MGEVMVTVARSNRLANKMEGFLNSHCNELCVALGKDDYPVNDNWFWSCGRKIESSHTHHRGIMRAADISMHRFAALRVGRKQRSFPDLRPAIPKLSVPVPYVKYGDYDPWPVLSPDIRGSLSELDILSNKLKWCYSKSNGVFDDPREAELYLGSQHPDYFDIMKKLGRENLSLDQRFYKQAEMMMPWLAEQLKPLDEFMSKLTKLWTD